MALPASGLAEHESIIKEIHQTLGEQQYAAARAEAEAMSIESAIEFVLSTVGR